MQLLYHGLECSCLVPSCFLRSRFVFSCLTRNCLVFVPRFALFTCTGMCSCLVGKRIWLVLEPSCLVGGGLQCSGFRFWYLDGFRLPFNFLHLGGWSTWLGRGSKAWNAVQFCSNYHHTSVSCRLSTYRLAWIESAKTSTDTRSVLQSFISKAAPGTTPMSAAAAVGTHHQDMAPEQQANFWRVFVQRLITIQNIAFTSTTLNHGSIWQLIGCWQTHLLSLVQHPC